MSDSEPTGRTEAYLFGNGNAMFFDADGEQITELQRDGLAGVHAFRERYPDATVYWAIWGDAEGAPVHEDALRYIRRPDEVPDVDGGDDE